MLNDYDRYKRMADIAEIKNLQGRYMYYIEQFSYEKIWEDLFDTNNPQVSAEFEESGCFEGPEQVKTLFLGLLELARGPVFGVFPMTTISTPLVVFNHDREKAKGYWHYFGPNAMEAFVYPNKKQELTAFWTGGKFANEYIRTQEGWRLLKLCQMNWFRTPYEMGWIKQPDCRRLRLPAYCVPDKPSRSYTYHPAAEYSKDGSYNWGPFPVHDGDFF